MKVILDTNICIYLIKKKPYTVFQRFKDFSLGSICISSITLAELQFGVRKSKQPEKNQEALNKFLLPLEIAEFDAKLKPLSNMGRLDQIWNEKVLQ